MAEDQVAEVKQKTDIVSLIAEYVNLKKAGRNYKANCPFHSEKTPSFMVSPELQIYKCFGCGESGDVFSFLERQEGMDFYEALKYLADKVGVKLVTQHPDLVNEKEMIVSINKEVAKLYQYMLLKTKVGKSALEYVAKTRGLTMASIKTFKIGFSPDVSLPIIKYLTQTKKYKNIELEKAGILAQGRSGAVDRYRGRIIFPLFDHRGNTIGFAGRIMPTPGSDKLAKYINTPDTPVYHKSKVLYGLNITKDDVKKEKSAVIVEGEIDLISCWQAGIKNVVAIKGSALTSEQSQLLLRFADTVVMCLDADTAGDNATIRGISIAEDAGLDVRVAKLTGFKDPDDAARKDPEGLKKMLSQSVGAWDFVIDTIFGRFDVSTGSGKTKLGRELIPILAGIKNKISQAHYLKLVAQRLEIPESVIESEILITANNQKPAFSDFIQAVNPQARDRRTLLEENLLSIAFTYNPNALVSKNIRNLIKTNRAKKILDLFLTLYGSDLSNFKIKEFSGKLPSELLEGFSEMVLIQTDNLKDPVKELVALAREIEIEEIKSRMQNIQKQMRASEVVKDKKILNKNKNEFNLLTNKLSEIKLKGSEYYLVD